MPLSDDAIVERVQRNLEACEPGFIGAQVLTCNLLGTHTVLMLSLSWLARLSSQESWLVNPIFKKTCMHKCKSHSPQCMAFCKPALNSCPLYGMQDKLHLHLDTLSRAAHLLLVNVSLGW